MPIRTTQTPFVVFEDSGWQKFLPLVYARAVFQLICGSGELLDKVRRLVSLTSDSIGEPATASQFASSSAPEFDVCQIPPLDKQSTDSLLALWCRGVLADVVAEQTGLSANQRRSQATVFLNARGAWKQLPEIHAAEGSWVGVTGRNRSIACIAADGALAQRLSPAALLDDIQTASLLAGVPRRDITPLVDLFEWPWELVLANGRWLKSDHAARRWGGTVKGKVADGSYILAREALHIGSGTRIKPCVVIDAEDGPVWIGRNVTILPHCYVQGPVYIGDGSLLQPGAVVHAGTTIGPRSKIGGEIEASIVQGFSNKQHDGFLGHSYVGSWVNIAADCINSDLKNTYGTVRVPINGREVETGEMFVGMLVGDYSKAGINVSFPTGAVIGFCSAVFAPRSPKFVPSFAWIDGDKAERFDEERGLAVARKVMARRSHHLSAAEERAFRAVRLQALAIEHEPQMQLECGCPPMPARRDESQAASRLTRPGEPPR